MFCKYCGKEIKGNAVFCPYCGKNQKKQRPSGKEKPNDSESSNEGSGDLNPKQPPQDQPQASNTDWDTEIQNDNNIISNEENPEENATAPTGRFPKRWIFIIVIVAVVVAIVIIALCVHHRNKNKSEAESQMSAETADTGEAAEAEEDGQKKRNTVSGSKEYKTAYNYASDNALTIIEYYVAYTDYNSEEYREGDYSDTLSYEEVLDIICEEESAFETEIDAFDPSFFSKVVAFRSSANDLVYEASDFYDIYAGDIGTNSYFTGIDIVDQFMNLDSDAYLVLTDLNVYAGVNEDARADACAVYGVYGDYAISCSGTIADIINQMCVFSGYNVVTQSVEGVINCLESKNYSEEDGDDNETVNGRKDALRDYLDAWEDAREQWETEFLEDYGLTRDDLDGTDLEADGTDAEADVSDAESRIYQLVDKDNNVMCQYIGPLADEIYVGSDGKWELCFGDRTIIMDKEANVLYDENKSIYAAINYVPLGPESMKSNEFSGMTPSGNLLTCSEDSDFEHGDFYILEWSGADGSTKEIMRGTYIVIEAVENEKMDYYTYGANNTKYSVIEPDWAYSDIWRITSRTMDGSLNDDMYIDMESGEIIENYEEEAEDTPKGYTRISPDYYMDDNTYYVYATDDLDNPVVDLSSSDGVNQLLYDIENDVYWIESKNKYYYKLDGEFNYLSDPVKISDDINSTNCEVTPYGLLCYKDEKYVVLQDEKGDEIFRHRGNIKSKQDDKLSTGFFANWGTSEFSQQYDYYYNLNSSDILCVTKPATSDDNGRTAKKKDAEDDTTKELDDAATNVKEEEKGDGEETLEGTSTHFLEDSVEATGGTSMEEATEVPLDTRVDVSADDGEWFSFTLEEPARVKMSAVATSGQLDYFHLYDAEGDEAHTLTTNGNGKTATYTTDKQWDAGTYYIWHAPYIGTMTDATFWIQEE